MPFEPGLPGPMFWLGFGLLVAILLGSKIAQLVLPEDHWLPRWIHDTEWRIRIGDDMSPHGGGHDCDPGGGEGD